MTLQSELGPLESDRLQTTQALHAGSQDRA